MKTFITTIVILCSSIGAMAQFDGARTYWAIPKNTNILTAHKITGSANASINNLNFINPDVTVGNNLNMLSYTRSQPVLGRTFFSTVIVPAGDFTANVNLDPKGPGSVSKTIYQHGLGDLIWSNTINLIGAKGLMIKDYIRHESPTQVYFQTAVTFPTGQYSSNSEMNIGSNQFKYKLGFPIIQRIGQWVDGKKMTLEVFPSYTITSKNKDYMGQEIDQEGLFILESHLTKDITKQSFLSLDYSYIQGGSSDFISQETGTIMRTQEGQDAHLIGATVKYKVNDQLHLFVTHQQTFSSSSDAVSFGGSLTKLTLSFSFHDFQEKFNDYINSN